MITGARPKDLAAEWSHRERLNDLTDTGRTLNLRAPADARARVADRLGLIAITRLDAHVRLMPTNNGVHLTGTVSADVTQSCVITLEPLDARVRAALDIQFVKNADPLDDPTSPHDIEPLTSDTLDIGEIAVQSLALALDPYPRSSSADVVAAAVGIQKEPEVDANLHSPFQSLSHVFKKQ